MCQSCIEPLRSRRNSSRLAWASILLTAADILIQLLGVRGFLVYVAVAAPCFLLHVCLSGTLRRPEPLELLPRPRSRLDIYHPDIIVLALDPPKQDAQDGSGGHRRIEKPTIAGGVELL